MRSGNIQVGAEGLLEDLFPETRFNSWTIAETHVIDPKVVPNGRRDNYEHSAHLSDLLTRLTPYTRKIANLCRSNSVARNAHQRIESELATFEERLQVAMKPRTPAFVVTAFSNEFDAAQPGLLKAVSKSIFDTPEGELFRARLRKLESKVITLAEKADGNDPLSDFPTKEREVLRQVIEAIHTIQGETHQADALVGKVLARLRRQRSANGSKK